MLGSRIQLDQLPLATSHVLVPGAGSRVCLTIYPPSAGTITISNEPIAPGGSGVILTPSSHPYRVHRNYDGTVCGLAHYVAYAGGATAAAYIETMD